MAAGHIAALPQGAGEDQPCPTGKIASFGLPMEGTRRWCRACSLGHPGAMDVSNAKCEDCQVRPSSSPANSWTMYRSIGPRPTGGVERVLSGEEGDLRAAGRQTALVPHLRQAARRRAAAATVGPGRATIAVHSDSPCHPRGTLALSIFAMAAIAAAIGSVCL